MFKKWYKIQVKTLKSAKGKCILVGKSPSNFRLQVFHLKVFFLNSIISQLSSQILFRLLAQTKKNPSLWSIHFLWELLTFLFERIIAAQRDTIRNIRSNVNSINTHIAKDALVIRDIPEDGIRVSIIKATLCRVNFDTVKKCFFRRNISKDLQPSPRTNDVLVAYVYCHSVIFKCSRSLNSNFSVAVSEAFESSRCVLKTALCRRYSCDYFVSSTTAK